MSDTPLLHAPELDALKADVRQVADRYPLIVRQALQVPHLSLKQLRERTSTLDGSTYTLGQIEGRLQLLVELGLLKEEEVPGVFGKVWRTFVDHCGVTPDPNIPGRTQP